MSIRKIGKYWYIDIAFEGRRIRRSTGLTNKEAAEKYQRRLEQALAEGKTSIVSLTLSELFDEYLRHCEKTVKPLTVDDRRRYCERLLDFFGDVKISDNKRADAQRYVDSHIGIVGNRTINEEYKTLREAYNFAVDREIIPTNQLSGVKTLQEKRRPIRILSDDELRTWFDYCRENDPLLYDLSVIALNTGLRRSDLLKIRGKDIDVERHQLTVEVSKRSGAQVLYIPLNGIAFEVLSRRKGNGYIFPGATDHLTSFRGRFAAALRATDIDFTFQMFRHNCATRMLEAGANINTVKEILGHSSIVTTSRYLSLIDELKKAAVDGIHVSNTS